MDYFSKNLEMRALKTKSAREVAQFIYEDIICRWGSPDIIITDQGREFCNAINDELMERAHCKHRITSSYHPQSNGLVERQNRTTTNFLLKNMDCQDDWVDMIPTMMGSHRHTVHSTTNIDPSAILLGCKPTLATDMLLRSEDYFNRELQDEEIEEIENGNYTEILKQLNFVRQSVFNTTSQNISMAQVSQKKYYDIRHSRNFKFAKNDIVIKFLPRNSERKGGKLEDKFSGPYVIDEITDLGIARLRTFKGKVLKKGVPIKQLQKYNKEDDKGNYSNTSSDTENEDQQRKRRRVSPDSESSKSVTPAKQDQPSVKQSVTPTKQDQPSVKQSVTPAKQDQPSVKQSVTPTKQDQLSVKQSVTPAKQDQPSVKQSVTPAKQDQPSVKQSVNQNTINDKESFTQKPKSHASTKHNKKKKIILTSMKSQITQIEGGIKKLQPQKKKFLFQNFTNQKEITETEIELCDTLPDLDDKNEDKVCVELCDTPNTLPDLHQQNNQQTNGHETQITVSQPEIQETGFYEGDPVLFFPITNSTRRNICPFFSLFHVKGVLRQMPDYKLGGTGHGVIPPTKCFVINGDGNCYFRAVSFILTGVEKHHFVVRQAICGFIAIHYDDLNLFLAKYKDGEAYLKDTKMRENSMWGTELEIIATATMAKRDVIVYNHTGYLRYQNPFAQKQTIECFFIDNRSGGHFNVILEI